MAWVATANGVNRCGGYSFKNYNINSLKGFPSTLRQTICPIRQEALNVDDFADQFKAHVPSMATNYPGSDIHFEENFEQAQTLSPAFALHFSRIGPEAVRNIHKHAKAACMAAYFGGNSAQHFTLSLKDTRCGFEVENGSKAGQHGLVNMQSRAQECGASLSIQSTPGAGSATSLQLGKEVAWT